MSLALEFYSFLETTVEADSTAGLYVYIVAKTFRFYHGQIKSITPVGGSQFLPLLEMYLTSKDISYEVSRRRAGALVRGIRFKSDDVRALADVVTLGIEASPDTLTKASNLCQRVFPNTKKV